MFKRVNLFHFNPEKYDTNYSVVTFGFEYIFPNHTDFNYCHIEIVNLQEYCKR